MANPFTSPMQPWPELAPYARVVSLPGAGRRIFTFQAGPPAPSGRPALILVHGLGDEADSWRSVLLPLSRSHQVVALDLPGFGRSDKPDIAYSLAYYGQVIKELVQTLQLPEVVLVGSSMGAVISQSLGLENPPWLKGLVLCDGSLSNEGQRLSLPLLMFLLPGLGEYLYNRLRKDPQAAYETLRPYYADLDALPEAERRFLYQRVNQRVWDDGQRRAYFSALRGLSAATARARHNQAALAGLRTPTLLVWGEADYIFPLASGQATARLLPDARLVQAPGAGHLPHQERPQEFLQILAADPRLGIDC
ncbi:MAG: alpha/beta fold hydrolase [Chloroflexota bacterium]